MVERKKTEKYFTLLYFTLLFNIAETAEHKNKLNFVVVGI